MKLISWLLSLILLFMALCFALHNGQKTTISLWPFDVTAEMPFYIVSLGTLFFGFLMGLVVSWIGHFSHRLEAYRLRRELALTLKKMGELRESMPFVGNPKGRDPLAWAKTRWRWRGKRT